MRIFLRQLTPYLFIFFLTQTVLRITLLVRSMLEIEIRTPEIVQIMLRGLWFDMVAGSFVLLPIALFLLFTRQRFLQKPAGRITQGIVFFILTFALLFGFISEHLFWSEFTTRFNFIAVDYLIYTQEVIGNINESYPVGLLVGGIAVLAAIITLGTYRKYFYAPFLTLGEKFKGFACHALVCFALYSASNMSQAQFDDNAEAGEIAASGIYNLFYAYWHNEINYDRFYVEHPKEKVKARSRELLDEGEEFEADGITRTIKPAGKELHKNVMIISMESMSADYMGAFGSDQNLTPNLDRLAKEGLFFTKLYATGTRTVRGLEAITLSIPPTPGQSIIRRANNDNLYSLGFIFQDRGYDTKFIYGGYGYFDNMNAFFAANGFDILDRTSMSKEETNFANVWGIVDDDMFARAIKEADASYKAGKPFMHLIMTTTNHRPYTYPDGKIDIPSKSSRIGGVKYADYAVGKLIEWSKTKPWFKDTVFVFVADHTAGAGGKAELDPKKYHIPMIFYSPGFIAPKHYDKIASQIDLAPILLGQLNFHYRSKFYGEDLMHDDDEIPHAFVSNYQKVALIKENEITVLAPKRKTTQYAWPDESAPRHDSSLIDDTVAYYQSASWWRETYKRIPTVVK